MTLLAAQPLPVPQPLAPTRASTTALDFDERATIPVIVTKSGNLRAVVSTADLFAEVAALLTEHTRARPLFVEGTRGNCEGDIRCLMMEARLAESGPIILWVSSQADEHTTFVRVRPLYTRQAALALQAGRSTGEIVDAATPTVAGTLMERQLAIHDGAELRPGLEPVISARFRPLFERVEMWGAVGSVAVEGAPPDCTVAVDGDRRSAVEPVRVLLGLRAGVRRVELECSGYEPRALDVRVESGRTAAIAPSWDHVLTRGYYARHATIWGGLGVAAAGGAVWAVSASGRSVTCLGTTATDGCGTVIPGEASWAIGLISGGLVASIGAWLGDEYDLPWVAWLAGAAAFGVTFGVVEAAR